MAPGGREPYDISTFVLYEIHLTKKNKCHVTLSSNFIFKSSIKLKRRGGLRTQDCPKNKLLTQ